MRVHVRSRGLEAFIIIGARSRLATDAEEEVMGLPNVRNDISNHIMFKF